MDLRVILVLGGARSGKSTFAENLAATPNANHVTYIATAKRSDSEMSARIAKHIEDRPESWSTVEEPLDLSKAIPNAFLESKSDVVVVDCLTCWLANYISQAGDIPGTEADIDDAAVAWSKHFDKISRNEIKVAIETAREAVASMPGSPFRKTLIFVSNETGMGIVPNYRVSRYYRDTIGRINQDISRNAQHVYFMVAGCALDIKKLGSDAKISGTIEVESQTKFSILSSASGLSAILVVFRGVCEVYSPIFNKKELFRPIAVRVNQTNENLAHFSIQIPDQYLPSSRYSSDVAKIRYELFAIHIETSLRSEVRKINLQSSVPIPRFVDSNDIISKCSVLSLTKNSVTMTVSMNLNDTFIPYGKSKVPIKVNLSQNNDSVTSKLELNIQLKHQWKYFGHLKQELIVATVNRNIEANGKSKDFDFELFLGTFLLSPSGPVYIPNEDFYFENRKLTTLDSPDLGSEPIYQSWYNLEVNVKKTDGFARFIKTLGGEPSGNAHHGFASKVNTDQQRCFISIPAVVNTCDHFIGQTDFVLRGTKEPVGGGMFTVFAT
ncbi:hypothetical protein HK096_002915 [Nowakowskiella sp. JEL0078]|nr:hypothetical protein HK096_002915 [Nowakowskiella sp. JEL0078]